MDLSTTYMGLALKNPFIAGSSGLSRSVKGVQNLAEAGAGAVVLKSLFQEEIFFESEEQIQTMKEKHPELRFFEYDGKMSPIEFYGYKVREDNLNNYKALISDCKEAVDIPIIASVNCFYDSLEWISFARELERAGADALELNMFFPPTDMGSSKKAKEDMYFEMVTQITDKLSIPLSLKISYYFTELGLMIQKLSETNIKGLVLFNRFFSPDFDIDTFEVKPSFVYSHPSELAMSLRWIAIMANKVSCELCASTGVHDSDAAVKQILAGARTIQLASALYQQGVGQLKEIISGFEAWMKKHSFDSIDDFRGKLSQEASSDPRMYERTQFMKYYAKGKKQA